MANYLEELEASTKQAQEHVDLASSLERLMNNRDFKKIVLNGYFEKEAIRLVHAKCSNENQTVDKQASIIMQIDAIGCLSKYLSDIMFKASIAVKTIEANDTTRDEIISED